MSRTLVLWFLAALAACGVRGGAPSASAEGVSRAPEKWALMVCVRDYESPAPARKDTSGWKNLATQKDAALLASVLVTRYAFKPENILILLDARAYQYAEDLFDPVTGFPKPGRELRGVPYNATLAGIRAAWNGFLIGRAEPGDTVVVHFSGHGEQLTDDGNDEPDRKDEAFVPYDYRGGGDENATADLRDDELSRLLKALRADISPGGGKPEGSLTVFFDSCHSGTVVRGTLTPRNNTRPTPAAVAASADEGLLRTEGSGLDDPAERIEGYVLLSACQSGESAYEYQPHGSPSRGGTFTVKLCEALSRMPPDAGYKDLFDEVSLGVRAVYPFQTPAIHGEIDRKLFGRARDALRVFPTVQPDSNFASGTFRVNIGQAYGLTDGSGLRLYPRAGEIGPGATPLQVDGKTVELRVTAVRLGDCDAVPEDPALVPRLTKEVAAGARAVVVRQVIGDQRWRVLLQGVPELARVLADDTLKPEEDALQIMTEAPAGGGGYDLRLAVESGPGGGKVLRLRSAGDNPIREFRWPLAEADRAGLRPALVNLWRKRLLYDLGAQAYEGDMKVEMRLIPTGAPQMLQGTLRLAEKKRFRIFVRNTGKVPVFLNILNIAPDGSLGLLFPDPRIPLSDRLEVGRELALPEFEVLPPLGLDLFKVIATPQVLDLAPLVFDAAQLPRGARRAREEQALAVSRSAPAETMPLQRLFLNTSMTRSARYTSTLSAWSAHSVTVQTHP